MADPDIRYHAIGLTPRLRSVRRARVVGRPRKYPWHLMEIGDEVPFQGDTENGARRTALNASNTTGFKFRKYVVEGRLVIRRTR